VNDKLDKGGILNRRPGQKSRGTIFFSDRLFSSSSTRVEDVDVDPEAVKKIWGSWGKKKPQPSVLPKESRPGSPSRLLTSSNSVHFSKSESTAEVEDTRKGKRRSLTPQCLRSLVTSSSQAATEIQGRVTLKRSKSRSQGHAVLDDVVGLTSNDDKRRVNPSRVGSPTIPKGRQPEPQTGMALQRTSSMKSDGKWGQRGRAFTSEFTRGRTVHPMFSFERPRSSDVASTTSSKETIEVRQADAGLSKSSKKVRVVARDNDLRSSSELGVSHPNSNSSHDNSTSGRMTVPGVARSDPGPNLKVPLMHRRPGAQAHGAFAFEPATAVVISARSEPRVGMHNSAAVRGSSGSLSKTTGVQARSLGSSKGHVKSGSEATHSKSQSIESHSERKVREYGEFCEELKIVLGDGADWTSFMNCE
jgi:hypothetical protein